MSGTLHIPRSLLDALVAHALDGLPNEVCGILGGREDRVERVMPLTNAAGSPEFYEADPDEQLAAYDALYEEGRSAIGVYHSHPSSPARPSATDIELAHDPDAVYAIVSLQDRSGPDVRAFHVRDGDVSDIDLTITED